MSLSELAKFFEQQRVMRVNICHNYLLGLKEGKKVEPIDALDQIFISLSVGYWVSASYFYATLEGLVLIIDRKIND